MIEFMNNIREERRKLVGPILLAFLLFLRLPYLIGMAALFPDKPSLVVFVFNNCTFLITALLIWVERERLSEFHITQFALDIFIWAPLLSQIIDLLILPNFSLGQIPLLHILISFCLLWNLKKSGSKTPQPNRHWLRWIVIAVLIGVCIGIVFGYFNGMQNQARVIEGKHRTLFEGVLMLFSFKSGVTVLPLFMIQLTNAATLEEPLFRGFLWGYLRIMGWKDKWILLFQAFLFWIGHIYYWSSAPYSLWIMVPCSGLVLGLMAWKSRSIAISMVSHGLFNSIGDFLAHY